MHLPAHLSFDEAATLPCAAVTAWNAVYGRAPAAVRPDRPGAGNGRRFDLRPPVRTRGRRASSSPRRLTKSSRGPSRSGQRGRELQARHRVQDSILELSDRRGVDHVVELGGPGILPRSMLATRIGGSVHLVGLSLARGQIGSGANHAPQHLPARLVRGFARDVRSNEPGHRLHRLRPVIDQVFPFEAAKEAYRHLTGQSHSGRW